ncbi:MAG TPA: hypothetical protein VFT66_11470 [Roseiflexaceae bacterium]|jgi:hypothetical protein|nr:hypothetical protein [Roseiflexaceae bacterium]
MSTIGRALRFSGFTLIEYMRSNRILVEIIVTIAVFYLFMWRSPITADYFFSTSGLFTLALSFYTTSAILGLGDRPEGYLVLVTRLGRSGYLLGLYFAALVVEFAMFGLLSLGVALLNRIADLSMLGWLLGTVPLLLNVALLSALLTLLAPIVLTGGWRLFVLALVAIAFSGSLINGPTLETLWDPVITALSVLRTIFSTPLLPAFTGYSLSVTRDYSGVNSIIPLTQLLLTLGLLALAVYAFARREIILSGS